MRQLRTRAQMTGLVILIAGFMSLVTSAQLDPVTARVERVIDGDTVQVRSEGKSDTVRLIGVTPRKRNIPPGRSSISGARPAPLPRLILKARPCAS